MRKYTICNAYVKQTDLVFVSTLKISQPCTVYNLLFYLQHKHIMSTLTWQEFLRQADQFMEISRDLDDNWELYKKVSNKLSFYSWLIKSLLLRTTKSPTVFLSIRKRLRVSWTPLNLSMWSIILYIAYRIKCLCCTFRSIDQVFT